MDNNDNLDDSLEVPLTEGQKLSPKEQKPETIPAKKQKEKSDKKTKNNGAKSHWAIKATVITFFLSAFFSFVAQMTATANNVIIVILLLLFLIIGSILFDGIGVAVAACELGPLTAMASRKVPGSKIAIKLVRNADVVSNVCNDVIGDIFGILAGACTVVITGKILFNASTLTEQLVTIAISSVVSAAIVGGKAFVKAYAIKQSKEFVMFTARFISVFTKESKSARKKK